MKHIARLDVFKAHSYEILQTRWSTATSMFDRVSLRSLSGLPFRFPCIGCAHFLLGRQDVPSLAQGAGDVNLISITAIHAYDSFQM